MERIADLLVEFTEVVKAGVSSHSTLEIEKQLAVYISVIFLLIVIFHFIFYGNDYEKYKKLYSDQKSSIIFHTLLSVLIAVVTKAIITYS